MKCVANDLILKGKYNKDHLITFTQAVANDLILKGKYNEESIKYRKPHKPHCQKR